MGKALKAGAVGGVVAAVINVILFYVGNIDPEVLTPMERPIDVAAVIAVSLITVVLAGVGLYLLRSRVGTYRLFIIILAVASLGMLAGLEEAPTSMLVTLSAMHLVAGAVAAFLVPKVAGPLG